MTKESLTFFLIGYYFYLFERILIFDQSALVLHHPFGCIYASPGLFIMADKTLVCGNRISIVVIADAQVRYQDFMAIFY
jgi:hypothetical protein